jgi:DNA processing protein
MEEILLYFAIKYQGNFKDIYRAISEKEEFNKEELERYKANMKCSYTTIISDDYPERLKHIACPPFVLFYYGDLSLTTKKTLGVIGMRNNTYYGKKATEYFVNELAKRNYVIVSGLAYGIDSIAHKQCIESNGQTIAVLGCGIDYCYPKENRDIYQIIKQGHLLISEYPFHTPPRKWQFPSRNRLIAGFSLGVLVTEARLKSGTMITVGYALEQGKEVMCVPEKYDESDGCNSLIQQGAKLVKNIEDIVELI